MPNGDDPPEANPSGTALPDDPELRNRMRLREEFRMEHLGGLDWLVKSEDHLLKIFRFYILVLGAFVSILSFRIDNGTTSGLLNSYTVSSLVFWTVAVVTTVVAFSEMSARKGLERIHRPVTSRGFLGKYVGVDKATVFDELDLDELVDQSPTAFEYDILYHYLQAIQDNQREMSRVRYPFLYMGMFLMVLSVLLFGIGMLVPSVQAKPFAEVIGALLGLDVFEILRTATVIDVFGFAIFFLGLVTAAYLIVQSLAVSGRFWAGIRGTKAFNPFSTEGLGYFQDYYYKPARNEEDNP